MTDARIAQPHDGLERCLRGIRQAQSLDTIWDWLVQSYLERGIAAIAYLLFDRTHHSDAIVLLEHGFPTDVIHRFAELGYGRDAPLLRIAMATGQPLLASEAARDHRFSRQEAGHRQAMLAAGLDDSLALPLYGPLGREAVVFLARPRDAASFDERDRMALHIIAVAAHLRSLAVLPEEPACPYDLSMRELEILRWVARGKSNAAIAKILDIAVGTVDTYLRRLFEKLDVTDRTSAAVRGVSAGLIRV